MEKTDLERLKELLNDFGVEFSYFEDETKILISCRQGDIKVGGYSSFFTEFDFDKNGKFIEMGAYE